MRREFSVGQSREFYKDLTETGNRATNVFGTQGKSIPFNLSDYRLFSLTFSLITLKIEVKRKPMSKLGTRCPIIKVLIQLIPKEITVNILKHQLSIFDRNKTS